MENVKKLWLLNILCAFLFIGCQPISAGEGAAFSPVSTPLTPSVVVSPSVAATSQPTVSPAFTITPHIPTQTPTVTPLPFLCPYLQGKTERGTFESQAMREEVRYLVHLPPCYDAYEGRAFPVLYLFHGWPLDEGHWGALGIADLADDWISRGIVGPFIIVMPGVSKEGLYVNSSGGSGSFEGMVVDELVPLIDSTYNTWREQSARAVGGISRGGVWALEIALRHQDIFGIVGAHSPALALNYPPPQYDPFVLAREGIQDLRIYLDAGDKDWARASTIQFRDLLEELGIAVRYEVHDGAHVDALWTSGLPDYVRYYTKMWPRSFDALPFYVAELDAEDVDDGP